MPRINEHYLNLQSSYLFAEIKRRTQAYREAHPQARIITLGIGDVTPGFAAAYRLIGRMARLCYDQLG